jgi:hypothetical protein
VLDRRDHECEVVVVESGEGVSEVDGDPFGQAGGKSEYALFA